jgi:hypothetical protein
MHTPLPAGDGFTDFTSLDLDDQGNFIDLGTEHPVPHDNVPTFLGRSLTLPDEITDIVIFVHGWNNPRYPDTVDNLVIFQMLEFPQEPTGYLTPGPIGWRCCRVGRSTPIGL